MLKAIPWNTIGPVVTGLVIILALVFGFILKFQKSIRIPATPPTDITTTSKKTLCFQHEGKIAGNTTAIEIFGAGLQEANRINGEQHSKLFDKLEEQGKEIVREIHKANGGGDV